jgi:hypothetical protein
MTELIGDENPKDIYLGMWVEVRNEAERVAAIAWLKQLKQYTLRKCPDSASFIEEEFIEKKCDKHSTVGIKMKFHGIWPYQSLNSTGIYLGN